MKQMLFALLLIFVPAQAWAGGCSCGSINSMITAAKMETIQAVNAHTAAEAEAIRSEIVLAAQNVIGTIKSESATIIRAIVALKESTAAALKGQGMADESTLGAGIQLGARAGQELQATMREKQHDYGNTQGVRPVEFLQRVLAEEHPSEQEALEALFPLQGTLTGEQVAQAHESIKTLANPRPLPVVTDEQKKTAAGQTYAAARRIHENRLAAVAEALNHHVVLHSPTLPEDVAAWAQNQWTEAGGSGTPPGLVDGRLSEIGLFKLLSQMRVGNPNWFAQLAASTDTGLLRELAMMQALQLELTRKNTEFLDRLSVIASLDFLARMEGTTGKDMEDLYARMVGAQQ